MKIYGKYFGLTAGILVCASNAGFSASPYAQVGARNVFGLNPPSAPVPETSPTEPLPKIIPNGIMSIFGNVQTLFKITDHRPGLPALEQAYILAEGQRKGDVEVIKIDVKNAVVTFNNHGTIQTIPIVTANIISGYPDAAGNSPQTAAPASAKFNPNRFMGPAGVALRNQMVRNQISDNTNPAEVSEGYAVSLSQNKTSSQEAEVVNGGDSTDAGNPAFRKARNLINWDLIGEQMVAIARERM